MNKWLIFFIFLLSSLSFSSQVQELAPCGEREFIVDYPRVVSNIWCIELPLEAGDAGEWAFTALAFTEDGRFYATRPLTGELLELVDTNNDRLPDSSIVVATGMRLPNGLAAEGNRIFIIGDGEVYRFENGELRTIADDLPHGRGFMASGIAVREGLVYLGIPYPCDVCEVDNELYGTVLEMAATGENRRIVARGLRYPAGLTFYHDDLLVSDVASESVQYGLDEINRIELNNPEIPDFGLTNCSRHIVERSITCNEGQAPLWYTIGQSVPLSFEAYNSSHFPWLEGSLLISLSGSFDNSEIRGYSLVAVRDESQAGLYIENILPSDHSITPSQVFHTQDGFIYYGASEVVNRRGAGIWGHRIYDAAVSPEGWIYASVGGRGIYVLRYTDVALETICERIRNCD